MTTLLAAVYVATLNDPSKHRVANTVGLDALVARGILWKHGRQAAREQAVQARLRGEHGQADQVDR